MRGTYNAALVMLKRNVEEWNQWKKRAAGLVNLRNADLSSVNLKNADLSSVNLSDANLKNADLRKASFRKANLSCADLRDVNLRDTDFSNANLSNANLTRIQALNANFGNATLTGACIWDWHINSDTNLDRVICEYVYLGYKSQNNKWIFLDRRPHNPNRIFAPGEFAQIFQKVRETIDLYFRDGVDWQAAAYSFQQIATTDGIPLDIQGIDKTDDGVIIRVKAPQNADTSKLEAEFWKGYKIGQKAFEGEKRNADRLITSQEKQIVRYEREINQLLAIVENSRTINITDNEIYGSGYNENLTGSSYTQGNTAIGNTRGDENTGK